MTDTSNQTHPVFVYGTLKGMRRGELIGKAKTVAPFLMFGGGFPVVVSPAHVKDIEARYGINTNLKGYVLGELYAVSDSELASLDNYEGAPSFYDKDKVEVEIYEWNMSTDDVDSAFGGKDFFHPVPGGGSGSFDAFMYTGREVLRSIPARPAIPPSPEGTVEWDR